MRDEYVSLKNVAWQYRAIGWIIGIIGVLCGGYICYSIITQEDASAIMKMGAVSLTVALTAIIIWIDVATFRAVSEFIYLCIRVEYNTRQRPQPQMVYQQPNPYVPQLQPQLNAPANYQQPVQETQQYYQQPVQETPQQYSPDQPEYYMPPENREEQQ